MKRSERLAGMTMMLTEVPNKLFSFGAFCERFGTAKSTVSEDIDLIRVSLERLGFGMVETIPGPNGGVRYRPTASPVFARQVLTDLANELSGAGRRLPGDFLYTADLTGDARVTHDLARIFATRFSADAPELVLTMETSGIPIALMTASVLSVPMVIARRDSHAYEGPAVKLNYVSGNADGHIETMALSRRSVREGQRVLIIDDFMKGGGTLNGMVALMREFNAEVIGVGVVIEAASRPVQHIKNAQSLLLLDGFDPVTNQPKVRPNPDFL